MRSEQYALRLIPVGFSVRLFSSKRAKRALDNLKVVIQSSFENAERFLKLNEEGSEEEVRKLDHGIKMLQLHNGGRIKHNDEKSSAYVAQQKKTMFGKTKQLNQSGLIRISSHVPKDALPYVSPPLIREVNQVSKLNELGIQNINALTKTLCVNEKKRLKDLQFQVNFNPSYMSSLQKPPEISQITSSLFVVNIYSKSAIPIKLSSDVLLGRGNGLQEFKSEFEKLSQKF